MTPYRRLLGPCTESRRRRLWPALALGTLLFAEPLPADPATPKALAPPMRQGVNYDPAWLQRDPEALVSAPLRVEMWVERGGATMELVGDFAAWSAGVSLAGPGSEAPFVSCPDGAAGQPMECAVYVFRFVQFGGTVRAADFRWLMELAESSGAPAGAVTGERLADGSGLAYPAAMRLDAQVVLTVQEGEAPPLRLRSRRPMTLAGQVGGWPPMTRDWPPIGVVLTLADGPVPFYPEDGVADAAAEPYLVVQRVLAGFGTQPTEFFSRRPEILETTAVDPGGAAWRNGPIGGAAVVWKPAAIGEYEAVITHYNLYRNPRPGDPTAWRLFARVPAAQTTVVDPQYDGRSSVEYLVTHGSEFPFGYRYEGVYGSPVAMTAVAEEPLGDE